MVDEIYELDNRKMIEFLELMEYHAFARSKDIMLPEIYSFLVLDRDVKPFIKTNYEISKRIKNSVDTAAIKREWVELVNSHDSIHLARALNENIKELFQDIKFNIETQRIINAQLL